MRVENAFLAQSISLNPDGTFFVFNGGVNLADASTLPSTLSALSALLQLVAESEDEVGEHRVRIRVIGPNQQQMAPPEHVFRFEKKSEFPWSDPKFIFVADLQGMPVNTEGVHEIRLEVDGRAVKSLSLFVRVKKNEG